MIIKNTSVFTEEGAFKNQDLYIQNGINRVNREGEIQYIIKTGEIVYGNVKN